MKIEKVSVFVEADCVYPANPSLKLSYRQEVMHEKEDITLREIDILSDTIMFMFTIFTQACLLQETVFHW